MLIIKFYIIAWYLYFHMYVGPIPQPSVPLYRKLCILHCTYVYTQIIKLQYSSVQTLHMCVPALFPHVKLKNMACTYAVAHNFDMHKIASEHVGHTSGACHELALCLPHYTCVAQVQQICTYIQTMICIGFLAGQFLIVFCHWRNIWACPY